MIELFNLSVQELISPNKNCFYCGFVSLITKIYFQNWTYFICLKCSDYADSNANDNMSVLQTNLFSTFQNDRLVFIITPELSW